MEISFRLAGAGIMALAIARGTWAGVTPIFNFPAPGGWAVGAAGSTYEEWAANSVDKIDGVPNVGFTANPSATQPTLTSPNAIVAGSGGFYGLNGTYDALAAISSPSSSGPAGAGTHVIVQSFSTINPDDGAGHSGTSLGVSLTAPTLLTGLVHLRTTTYAYQSGFATSSGPVDVQATIDEFWIPNYTGDFTADIQEIQHSSMQGVRVDSEIVQPAVGGGSPFAPTVVPEPATVGVLACGLGLLAARGRRARRR